LVEVALVKLEGFSNRVVLAWHKVLNASRRLALGRSRFVLSRGDFIGNFLQVAEEVLIIDDASVESGGPQQFVLFLLTLSQRLRNVPENSF
jgi:hypothetical protein